MENIETSEPLVIETVKLKTKNCSLTCHVTLYVVTDPLFPGQDMYFLSSAVLPLP